MPQPVWTAKLIRDLERGVRECFRATLGWGARKATYFIRDDLVVKATRRRPQNRRDRSAEMVLTYGRPNFVERRFVRLCKQSGEKLPLRKVQVQWWPKKR